MPNTPKVGPAVFRPDGQGQRIDVPVGGTVLKCRSTAPDHPVKDVIDQYGGATTRDDLPLHVQLAMARDTVREKCIENAQLRRQIASLNVEVQRLQGVLAAHQQVGA
jgi:hypothetical protein